MENRDNSHSTENEDTPQSRTGKTALLSDAKEETSVGAQAGTSNTGSLGADDSAGVGGGSRPVSGGDEGELRGLGEGLGLRSRARQPFTEMNQLESDMALARAIQEQERAFVLLRSAGARPGDLGHAGGVGGLELGGRAGDAAPEFNAGEEEDNSGGGSEGHARESQEARLGRGALARPDDMDGSMFESDEAFARALQEAEDGEMTARLMALAGVGSGEGEDEDDDEEGAGGEAEGEEEEEEYHEDGEEQERDDGSEDEDEEGVPHYEYEDLMYAAAMGGGLDPDNMSYEELVALGEAVGSESRGLTDADVAQLPTSVFSSESESRRQSISGAEQCVICRSEFEKGDSLMTLPCSHHYHGPCIIQWLKINKMCPMCGKEVVV